MHHTPEQFAEWLARARAGDAEALGHLMAVCEGYLRSLPAADIDSDLRAKGSTSDLLQDVRLLVCRHFASFRGDSEPEFLGWLRTIIGREAQDFRRHYRDTAKRAAAAEVPLNGEGSSDAAAAGPEAASPSPSSDAAGREAAEAVRRAVAALPPEQRDIVRLHIEQGLSFAEVARRIGRPESTTRMIFAQAVCSLGDQLRGYV